MITLTVYQKGGATYESGVSMQFNPQYMYKMQLTEFGGDSTCTQFDYLATTYIVAQSVSQVCTLITTASTITLTEVVDEGITQATVAFHLQWVQYVQDIDGYAGVVFTNPNANFASTMSCVSTTNTDYAGVTAALVAYGFTPVEMELSDGTTRAILINPNAVADITGDATVPLTYILPSGQQLSGYTLYTYTSEDWSGITGGDTIDTIETSEGTITLNLPCNSGANKTAIAAAITAWLLAGGYQYGTVAVTAPSAGKMRIVVPDTNIVFIDGVVTISATPTTKTFTAS